VFLAGTLRAFPELALLVGHFPAGLFRLGSEFLVHPPGLAFELVGFLLKSGLPKVLGRFHEMFELLLHFLMMGTEFEALSLGEFGVGFGFFSLSAICLIAIGGVP
jgi:hypothetical protein